MPDDNYPKITFKGTKNLDEIDLNMIHGSITSFHLSQKKLPKYAILLIAEDSFERDEAYSKIGLSINLANARATSSCTVKHVAKKYIYVDALAYSDDQAHENIVSNCDKNPFFKKNSALFVLDEQSADHIGTYKLIADV